MDEKPEFLSYEKTAEFFQGKTVCVVGSGPGVLDNQGEFIDAHDIVVRVNNYKTGKYADLTGRRTDVFYSFFGSSVRKTVEELQADGVQICMAKCPDGRVCRSLWHERRGATKGVDFRWIYSARRSWWFCPVYVPTMERFQTYFRMFGEQPGEVSDPPGHMPTTGFSCILDVLSFDCKAVYITGFDFFQSRKHNVDEGWRERNPDDPVRHLPERELEWLRQNIPGHVTTDKRLRRLLNVVSV